MGNLLGITLTHCCHSTLYARSLRLYALTAERCAAVAAGLGLADALAEGPEPRPHACVPMPEKISRNRPGRMLLCVC